MLFNLLLASITTLLCFFFLFLVILKNFFIIPVVKENVKLKLALANPAGAPIALVKEIKQLKSYQSNQKQQYIFSVFYSLSFFLQFLS